MSDAVETRDLLKVVELDPGFLLIQVKPRGETKKSKDKGMLPPSDFFVVKPGDSGIAMGYEVILKPAARMAIFKDYPDVYIVERSEISAHIPC